MPFDIQHKNSYLMAVVMFALSANVYEIFAVEICKILTLTKRIGQGQMSMYQSKVNMGPSEIITFYSSQIASIRFFDFEKVGQGHNLRRR